jgi:hypothetical protein
MRSQNTEIHKLTPPVTVSSYLYIHGCTQDSSNGRRKVFCILRILAVLLIRGIPIPIAVLDRRSSLACSRMCNRRRFLYPWLFGTGFGSSVGGQTRRRPDVFRSCARHGNNNLFRASSSSSSSSSCPWWFLICAAGAAGARSFSEKRREY